MKRLFFTSRDVSKGDPFEKEDLYVKKINIFENPAGSISRPGEILGKVLTKNLKKDDMVTLKDVEDPPLVKKGDVVALVAQNRSLTIRTSGISRQDGFVNDVIKVENLYSGELVQGRVTRKSTVEVIY